MNFLDELTEGLQNSPKQEFEASKAIDLDAGTTTDDGKTEPSGAESASTDDQQDTEKNTGNPSSEDDRLKEAAVWVYAADLLLSRSLAFYGQSNESSEIYKVTDGEKKDLTKVLADYFATLKQTPKLPPWAVLLIAVMMIYSPKLYRASQKRKSSKTGKRQASNAETGKTSERPKATVKPEFKEPAKPTEKKSDETVYTETGETKDGLTIMKQIEEPKKDTTDEH